MTSERNSARECQVCQRGDGVCSGEVVSFSTSLTREVFVRCGPGDPSDSLQDQAKKFYDCLPGLLASQKADLSHVLLERVFFRDIHHEFEAFQEARTEAYHRAGIAGQELPASSYVEQPPCRSKQAFELQAYAIIGLESENVRVRSFPAKEGGATAKLVEVGGLHHLYVTGLTGLQSGNGVRSFRQQSDAMFQSADRVLRESGTDFSTVLRTWCYLDNIDRDYDQFNASRNEFFQREGITTLPASTGIRSGLRPPGTLCAMDLYALLDSEAATAEIMQTPTLNEASEYGSAFSRGMKLSLPDKTVLFISGTASVDEYGATVHVGDVRAQIQRMLLNVQELLAPHGATFRDMAQAITYLKSCRDLDTFLEIWQQWGLEGLPNTCVEAGVCRPELLCEIEAIAILPNRSCP